MFGRNVSCQTDDNLHRSAFKFIRHPSTASFFPVSQQLFQLTAVSWASGAAADSAQNRRLRSPPVVHRYNTIISSSTASICPSTSPAPDGGSVRLCSTLLRSVQSAARSVGNSFSASRSAQSASRSCMRAVRWLRNHRNERARCRRIWIPI